MEENVRARVAISGRVQGVFLDWRQNMRLIDMVFSDG